MTDQKPEPTPVDIMAKWAEEDRARRAKDHRWWMFWALIKLVAIVTVTGCFIAYALGEIRKAEATYCMEVDGPALNDCLNRCAKQPRSEKHCTDTCRDLACLRWHLPTDE